MNDSGTRLFVGNLPENTVESDLRKAFSSYGDIISLDLKNKSAVDEGQKKFAFITISASNYEIESCTRKFANEDFNGNKLYVTRARESFLERLQRERLQGNKKQDEKPVNGDILPKKNPVIKLGDKLNPRKRKSEDVSEKPQKHHRTFERITEHEVNLYNYNGDISKPLTEKDKKKNDSEKKRLESIKQKRKEFKEKQMIIKTGLFGVDKAPNKKTVFSDAEEDTKITKTKSLNNNEKKKNTLFEDDDSDNEVNFEVKKQFEGKKGQKVLDLQSRYKSDKRFVLDERFVDDEPSDDEKGERQENDNEDIELEQTDEKAKQLNILGDVLGLSIKPKVNESDKNKKTKAKLGMLRFDPLQPDHSRFLAPVEKITEQIKKSKKKKNVTEEETKTETEELVEKVEVSKDQFYNVSETLKEAIAQPEKPFSLRSLFSKNHDDSETIDNEQEADYIPLKLDTTSKTKNPLDPTNKTPFVYDSSDSETEDKNDDHKIALKTDEAPAPKAVWKENLFFSISDIRLKEGLQFFNNIEGNERHKDRRELKSLMKKRIYNKERKNQMFQKKIGGRRKTMKKSFRKKT